MQPACHRKKITFWAGSHFLLAWNYGSEHLKHHNKRFSQCSTQANNTQERSVSSYSSRLLIVSSQSNKLCCGSLNYHGEEGCFDGCFLRYNTIGLARCWLFHIVRVDSQLKAPTITTNAYLKSTLANRTKWYFLFLVATGINRDTSVEFSHLILAFPAVST